MSDRAPGMRRETLRQYFNRIFCTLFGRCRECYGRQQQGQSWGYGYFYKCERCGAEEWRADS